MKYTIDQLSINVKPFYHPGDPSEYINVSLISDGKIINALSLHKPDMEILKDALNKYFEGSK